MLGGGGGLGSMLMGGMAMGAGSEIAHQAVRGMMGGSGGGSHGGSNEGNHNDGGNQMQQRDDGEVQN